MTDIRDASPHPDGFELPPGLPYFGISPEDVPYGDDCFDDDDDWFDDPGPQRPHGSPVLDSASDEALARAIAEGMREHGCDNTSRAAKAWARREQVPWAWLRDALEERGGFCDCEVLLNVLELPD